MSQLDTEKQKVLDRVALLEIDGKRYALISGKRYLLGRKTESSIADIKLADDSVDIKHAIIRVCTKSVIIMDLKSRTGTYYNHERLGGLAEVALVKFSTVRFGNVLGKLLFDFIKNQANGTTDEPEWTRIINGDCTHANGDGCETPMSIAEFLYESNVTDENTKETYIAETQATQCSYSLRSTQKMDANTMAPSANRKMELNRCRSFIPTCNSGDGYKMNKTMQGNALVKDGAILGKEHNEKPMTGDNNTSDFYSIADDLNALTAPHVVDMSRYNFSTSSSPDIFGDDVDGDVSILISNAKGERQHYDDKGDSELRDAECTFFQRPEENDLRGDIASQTVSIAKSTSTKLHSQLREDTVTCDGKNDERQMRSREDCFNRTMTITDENNDLSGLPATENDTEASMSYHLDFCDYRPAADPSTDSNILISLSAATKCRKHCDDNVVAELCDNKYTAAQHSYSLRSTAKAAGKSTMKPSSSGAKMAILNCSGDVNVRDKSKRRNSRKNTPPKDDATIGGEKHDERLTKRKNASRLVACRSVSNVNKSPLNCETMTVDNNTVAGSIVNNSDALTLHDIDMGRYRLPTAPTPDMFGNNDNENDNDNNGKNDDVGDNDGIGDEMGNASNVFKKKNTNRDPGATTKYEKMTKIWNKSDHTLLGANDADMNDVDANIDNIAPKLSNKMKSKVAKKSYGAGNRQIDGSVGTKIVKEQAIAHKRAKKDDNFSTPEIVANFFRPTATLPDSRPHNTLPTRRMISFESNSDRDDNVGKCSVRPVIKNDFGALVSCVRDATVAARTEIRGPKVDRNYVRIDDNDKVVAEVGKALNTQQNKASNNSQGNCYMTRSRDKAINKATDVEQNESVRLPIVSGGRSSKKPIVEAVDSFLNLCSGKLHAHDMHASKLATKKEATVTKTVTFKLDSDAGNHETSEAIPSNRRSKYQSRPTTLKDATTIASTNSNSSNNNNNRNRNSKSNNNTASKRRKRM